MWTTLRRDSTCRLSTVSSIGIAVTEIYHWGQGFWLLFPGGVNHGGFFNIPLWEDIHPPLQPSTLLPVFHKVRYCDSITHRVNIIQVPDLLFMHWKYYPCHYEQGALPPDWPWNIYGDREFRPGKFRGRNHIMWREDWSLYIRYANLRQWESPWTPLIAVHLTYEVISKILIGVPLSWCCLLIQPVEKAGHI